MPRAAVADEHENLGPISATPELMVRRALDFADVGPNDVVYDLGCNDGRVCVAAATERGARGVGVEIDAGACALARMRVETGACRVAGERLFDCLREVITD
jgi:cyclopropane fatty-acyl-phospholipid synthase-like methyltransferase